MLLLKNGTLKIGGWFCLIIKLRLVSSINSKSWFWSLLVLILGGLTGCQPPVIKIEQIQQKKSGKVVYLTGKVTQKAPFINTAAYQIQDQTGSVWVVTQQTPPAIEQKIAIKGKIQYQSLPLAQQELGDFYIQELEQSLTIEELK